MFDLDTAPTAPIWATDVGLDAPRDGETFRLYAKRLGFNAAEVEEFFIELTPRTAEMANRRLTHRLRKMMPAAWDAYIENTVTSQLTDEQRTRIWQTRWQNSWM